MNAALLGVQDKEPEKPCPEAPEADRKATLPRSALTLVSSIAVACLCLCLAAVIDYFMRQPLPKGISPVLSAIIADAAQDKSVTNTLLVVIAAVLKLLFALSLIQFVLTALSRMGWPLLDFQGVVNKITELKTDAPASGAWHAIRGFISSPQLVATGLLSAAPVIVAVSASTSLPPASAANAHQGTGQGSNPDPIAAKQTPDNEQMQLVQQQITDLNQRLSDSDRSSSEQTLITIENELRQGLERLNAEVTDIPLTTYDRLKDANKEVLGNIRNSLANLDTQTKQMQVSADKHASDISAAIGKASDANQKAIADNLEESRRIETLADGLVNYDIDVDQHLWRYFYRKDSNRELHRPNDDVR